MPFDTNDFLILGVLDWVIRILALFIVPRNRKPSSATAWLMLILLLPIIGVLIFILLGSPKLNRRRRAMQKHMDDAIKQTLEQSKSRFESFIPKTLPRRAEPYIRLNEKLGGFPVFSGNETTLISDYTGAIDSIVKDLDHAKLFIHIEYYIIAYDATTKPLFRALERAVKRGVKVRLMFDSIGSRKYPDYDYMKEHLTNIGVECHASP
jgi:cardiolipin synthase A/B